MGGRKAKDFQLPTLSLQRNEREKVVNLPRVIEQERYKEALSSSPYYCINIFCLLS